MFHPKISPWLLTLAVSVPSVGLVPAQQALANTDYFGAIAYSSATGSHGYSYDYATSQAATNAALRYCESYSGTGDCKALVVFRNACGALAQASDNSAGSGWGIDRPTAESYALQSCRQYGPTCRVIRWVCTSR